MKRLLRRLSRLLLIGVVIVVAAGVWQRERIGRLMAVNSLFEAEKIVANFSHMDAAFLTAEVARGDGPVSPLPAGDKQPLPTGAGEWMADRAITGIVVLKRGRVVSETYGLGTGPDDLRISWSVAKSFLSALLGIVLDEGQIASIDDPVTKYAPALVGSAYDGATIRNVANMASGVRFNEDYLDYNSDINKMGRVLALGGSMDAFAAGLKDRERAPGTVWQYVSIDTHVLGMVIEGATGRRIPDLMSEKLIAPLGLEQAPYYIVDSHENAFVLGGLNMRTRDYARFGQMIAQDGRWQGRQIVPEDWVRASTAASAPTAPGAAKYGFQWWIPVDARPDEFYGHGVYGQFLYIDRPHEVVIAVNAADRKFKEAGVTEEDIAMFRRIVDGMEGG